MGQSCTCVAEDAVYVMAPAAGSHSSAINGCKYICCEGKPAQYEQDLAKMWEADFALLPSHVKLTCVSTQSCIILFTHGH